MLHGALGSGEQLRPLADAFRGGRQVFTPDFSGHGGKAAAAGAAGDTAGFRIGDFAADLIGFLDDHRIDRADIFGYSMGGYVALHAARHNPGRIGAIMTLGTKFEWNVTTAQKEASRLDPAVVEAKVPAFAARLRALHGDAWTEVARSTARMMLELGANPALTDPDFQSISNRVLLSVGDRDEMVGIQETISAYRQLRNGTCLVLPGTRHPIEFADQDLLVHHIGLFFGVPHQPDPTDTGPENTITQNQ